MNGNVQLPTDGQFNELRIALVRAFDQLQGRLDRTSAQGFIGKAEELKKLVERLLPDRKGSRLVPKVKRKIITDFCHSVGGNPVDALLQMYRPEREVVTQVIQFAWSQEFTVSRESVNVAFCVLTLEDMGFTYSAPYEEICTQKFLDEWSSDNLEGQKILLCKQEDALTIDPWTLLGRRSKYHWFVTRLFKKKLFMVRSRPKAYHSSQLLTYSTKERTHIGLGDHLVFRIVSV